MGWAARAWRGGYGWGAISCESIRHSISGKLRLAIDLTSEPWPGNAAGFPARAFRIYGGGYWASAAGAAIDEGLCRTR